ncbi:hypothetical protein [Paracoccus homiensis]|nr:hypothetical protein [Paracoccus homiensis]
MLATGVSQDEIDAVEGDHEAVNAAVLDVRDTMVVKLSSLI